MATYIIIPAHLESSRLPRKLLLRETGKPLLQHTWETCAKIADAQLFVATNSHEIRCACERFGAQVLYSPEPTFCGNHRVVQAFLKHIRSKACDVRTTRGEAPGADHPTDESDVVVNVQGEWPTVDIGSIRRIAREVGAQSEPAMASLYFKGPAADDPNLVKVVLADRPGSRTDVDTPQRALYFSRAPVPYGATHFNYHIGVFAMNRRLAHDYDALSLDSGSYHFDSEHVDQLRVLMHNYPIWMFETKPTIGVDTRELYDCFKRELREGRSSRGQGAYSV
jgi:3-deoxy-manno-octulosonate cytidylyltransferase (CMP-KDO synthetase)